ncbi:MAG: ABC transporter ATP-binding protein [Betaproteobacteria bacterium RIFCSPLOWO2_12_FULL_63_13]|nr:MAG: ABC transporter ATP-binding protein [Betaproteobacteria bacterium RIFCSPLOWO2_02_FULL_63_19]OGA45424.1 MAG: ABC transporter ATP-binding protein [Betaproteobacteria bacterium RIFCSPLOWO2_12_FULL_63_13]
MKAKSSRENVVEVVEIRLAYGNREVLRGLSLKIPRGKVVAILGASGCGKTSLLRMIGGQLRPRRGHVKVDGQVVHRLNREKLYALRRRMGMMFQVSGLFSDLSVYENIAFPMREHTRLPEDLIRRLVLMKLNAVGLRGAYALMPGDLSGGMARRVALARAIAMDPMLAMYDEPFAGLDPISLNVISDLIRRLNDSLGTTSIIVTYDVKEALKVADLVYIIGDGVLAGQGTPDEIRSSDDPFVRQFINAEPDGPILFHYPSRPITVDLKMRRVRH